MFALILTKGITTRKGKRERTQIKRSLLEDFLEVILMILSKAVVMFLSVIINERCWWQQVPKKTIIDSWKHVRHSWCNTWGLGWPSRQIQRCFSFRWFRYLASFWSLLFITAAFWHDFFFFFFIISFAKSSSGRQTLHNREALVSLFTLLLLCEKQGYSQLNWLYRSVEVTFTNQQLQINTLH